MPEIKLYLSNKTKVDVEFSIDDDISITIPAHSSRIVSAQSGINLYVSSKGLVGDMWIYEINEDISLDCLLVGEELELRAGSPIR
jgi:hypothetical protein